MLLHLLDIMQIGIQTINVAEIWWLLMIMGVGATEFSALSVRMKRDHFCAGRRRAQLSFNIANTG